MAIASPLEEAGTGPCAEHAVLFYERESELTAKLAEYLAEGLSRGAATVVIATPEHTAASLQHVRASGVNVPAALHEGRLHLLDAADTLAALTVDGELDPDAFERVVGDLLRALAAEGFELCAYGEMVSLLWDAGNCGAAIELETMWNGLAEDLSFRLLCAYSTLSVDGHNQRDALEQVCSLHSAVLAPAGDAPAAPGLIRAEFDHDVSSPARARRLVEAALRAEGHSESLMFGAALTVGELASNAVRHAGTGFALTVLRSGETLRIEVRDFAPEEGGRAAGQVRLPHGLGLIDASAAQWGIEPSADGKLAWAEFHTGP
ncbi:MAG: hypothetical protein QOK19_2427 [Solirubrobacteraceae bacterium]|nr:hypothetical protein [Solirubrobacteraceae bacterium]